MFVVLFFFFKQKTAYEMRISDWSSDVALPILKRPRQQIELVSLDAGGRAVRQGLHLAGQQAHAQRLGDVPRKILLQHEDIADVAIVAPRPDVAAAGALDELRRDAHPAAELADAALEHVGRPQAARGLLGGRALFAVARAAVDYRQQACKLRQVGADVLGQALGEVRLHRIVADVAEGQAGERESGVWGKSVEERDKYG